MANDTKSSTFVACSSMSRVGWGGQNDIETGTLSTPFVIQTSDSPSMSIAMNSGMNTITYT